MPKKDILKQHVKEGVSLIEYNYGIKVPKSFDYLYLIGADDVDGETFEDFFIAECSPSLWTIINVKKEKFNKFCQRILECFKDEEDEYYPYISKTSLTFSIFNKSLLLNKTIEILNIDLYIKETTRDNIYIEFHVCDDEFKEIRDLTLILDKLESENLLNYDEYEVVFD